MSMAFGLLLEKLAYGPEDIGRVMGAASRRKLRAPPVVVASGAPASAYYGPPAAQDRKMRRAAAAARASEVPLIEAAPPTVPPEVRAQFAGYDKPGIMLAPGKYGELPMLEFMYNRSSGRLDKANRRALSSIIRGHELDELGAAKRSPSLVTAGVGHAAPDVIFREHNRVATLPPELRPAGDVLRTMRRSTGEGDLLLGRFGITYGEGRISRHARRRLQESLERKGVRLDASDPLHQQITYPRLTTAQTVAGNAARQQTIQAARAQGLPDPDVFTLFPQLPRPQLRPPPPPPPSAAMRALEEKARQRPLAPPGAYSKLRAQANPPLPGRTAPTLEELLRAQNSG